MQPSEAVWRKSSYSGANGGECVEVGNPPGLIAVRDSKGPHWSQTHHEPQRVPSPR